ncbi:MAG: alpha-amylase family glycosyl hydrolase [Candidatus Saccharimonadales bacterium]
MKTWRDVNAIYQIYPRSFLDTNHDGVGDLIGIIEKLDYLKTTLGIDAFWTSPIYRSPMADYGYDVSDYCDIDPVFGTLDDFKTLLREAHARDLKVMMDIVPNHTSDQHAWFTESRASRDNPKRDWYVWRDAKPDGSMPNNWLSQSGGPAWTRDEATGQYYLHSFMPEQPDLNWENPEVRDAMKDVLRFWFDMGVDGFRADAVWGLSKDPDLADDPRNPDYHGQADEYGYYIHRSCKQGPYFIERLTELVAVAKEYDDKFMIFEYYPDDKLGDIMQQYQEVYSIDPAVCSSFFFEGFRQPWSAQVFGTIYHDFLSGLDENSLPAMSISNHDQPRIASRLSQAQARIVAMLQLTLPGLPLIYNGDEIGMEDVELSSEELKDQFDVRTGIFGGRDPERTPVQWDDTRYAGFSDVKPWLPVSPNRTTINVATQLADDDSMLALHRYLIDLRSHSETLRHGWFETIEVNNGYVFAYKRSSENERYYVLLNFDNHDQRVQLPEACTVVRSTHTYDEVSIDNNHSLTLSPYQGLIVRSTL